VLAVSVATEVVSAVQAVAVMHLPVPATIAPALSNNGTLPNGQLLLAAVALQVVAPTVKSGTV